MNGCPERTLHDTAVMLYQGSGGLVIALMPLMAPEENNSRMKNNYLYMGDDYFRESKVDMYSRPKKRQMKYQ